VVHSSYSSSSYLRVKEIKTSIHVTLDLLADAHEADFSSPSPSLLSVSFSTSLPVE